MKYLPKETGRIAFVSKGLFEAEWLYKDHIIRMAMPTEWADDPKKLTTGISIWMCGVDITDKYVDLVESAVNPPEIRTTLNNLMAVLRLIDDNMEDFDEWEGDDIRNEK